MTRLALKVDVDTLRGTLAGVPPLVSMLQRHGVNATFLFSLGPDNTGRALRRIFRPGFLAKAPEYQQSATIPRLLVLCARRR